MTDITELFSRDPLKLTDSDITLIIEEMRNKRRLYESGSANPKKPAAPKKPGKPKASTGLNLDLKL